MLLRVYVTLYACSFRMYISCAHTPHMYVRHVYVDSFDCRFVFIYVSPPCVSFPVYVSLCVYDPSELCPLLVYVPSVNSVRMPSYVHV